MTMLIKIGNSQGVRIPKAIIKQAHLENAPLEFEVTAQGLLLKPIQRKPREGWAEAFKEMAASGDDALLIDDGLDLDFDEWTA
ncbi:AbrB/MazE/SpoVT family DNA-binding domain-containing protein [Sulfuricurvum sp.]|uniref:AbrB/MazE/SpoVT family DNA-binding domain-containing protein n=1 Tax=Sulfuricurvum sp. TaxID=2025608 RepID=UPI003BB6805E